MCQGRMWKLGHLSWRHSHLDYISAYVWCLSRPSAQMVICTISFTVLGTRWKFERNTESRDKMLHDFWCISMSTRAFCRTFCVVVDICVLKNARLFNILKLWSASVWSILISRCDNLIFLNVQFPFSQVKFSEDSRPWQQFQRPASWLPRRPSLP